MVTKRRWTAEEEYYLQDSWGRTSITGIANHLGRTVNAVTVRANRLGLGAMLESGEYVTLNQLLIAVKGTTSGAGYAIKSWVKNRGLPVHNKLVINNRFRVVYLDEFWEWAEKNRSFIDFSKMEPFSLGKEPAWVAEQRKKDFQNYALQRKDRWTAEDDSRLIMLVKQQKYGYAELSKILRRSAGAIQKRCADLGIKERPLRVDPHGGKWTEAHYEILADGIRNGCSYGQIGISLGKSEKAVRGKAYCLYLTEDADKIRSMMGDNPWGYGAPEPKVKQAIVLSRTRAETKSLLSQLCGVLACRGNTEKTDYDHYFQRAICVNWNALESQCNAGCDDCDSCAEFVRIQPQHCTKCGAIFHERMSNSRCMVCRAKETRI